MKILHALIAGLRLANSILARRIPFPLLFLATVLVLVQPCAGLDNAALGTWTVTGSLANARTWHTATLLPNGQVLVAGGFGTSGTLASVELYDPANGTWTATGSLATARFQHTATLLPNGKVLVAGGFLGGQIGQALASAELYDPASGTWTVTGSLATARYGHTATLLPNGMVLVAGGENLSGAIASAELYDPASGTWTVTGSLANKRLAHTATLLPNGKVLVAGGVSRSFFLTSAELYDPASGTWTATGSLATACDNHSATLLPNGKVLVAGGAHIHRELASAELYDPSSGTWSATGNLAQAREQHTATLLPNGQVLAAGGYDQGSGNTIGSAELYDLASGTWTMTGSLANARTQHTATLLSNGQVLVAGGLGTSSDLSELASAELYNNGINLLSAASRLTHGAAGAFDISMPLTGTPGLEDRSSSTYNAVFTFDAPVTSGAVTVVSGTAVAGTATFSGNTMSVPLTGVANAQSVTLQLSNINGDTNPNDGTVAFSFLIGDTTADGSVNAGDIGQTKSQSGNSVTASNFREDVNLDGSINAGDIGLVKSESGTGLP